MKLNLGCGTKTFKGWINVDVEKAKGVDIVCDLNKYPWKKFKSNSIEEVYCDNILEHLDNFDKALKEIHRILKKNGTVLIRVPYFSNPYAFNPAHKSFFNLDSLDMYFVNTPEGRDIKRPLFKLIYKKIIFHGQYQKGLIKFLCDIFYSFPKFFYEINPKIYIMTLSYLFPAAEINYKLKKP